MIITSFLHWTTKSLCRRGEDSCAFKCEKDTWCAHLIEEIAWCWGHLLIFCSLSAKWSPQQTYPQLWRALNNYFLHRHCFAVHKTSQKTLSALPTTFLFFLLSLTKRRALLLMKQWCRIACVDMKKNLCKCIIATAYLLFTRTAVWNPQTLWTDVNCNLSYIGNQVWYVITGANFMHITCLLLVWLSLGLTTTRALGVQVSMPNCNTRGKEISQ